MNVSPVDAATAAALELDRAVDPDGTLDYSPETCWDFIGFDLNGRKVFDIDGVFYPAQEVAYLLAHGAGSLSPGQQVVAACSNPDCVRPSHLLAVTPLPLN